MSALTDMLQRLLPSSIQSVLRFFSSPQKPSIQKLPDEIFVDILFSYLELRDILNLREVCRWFYDLTHHEVVWKRLLQTSPLPIPPLPPLSRYKFDNLSAIEVQTLLVRAQSLERNWRKDGATPGVWSFDLEYRVEEVALLPGSKYLVASISDSTKRNWGIILCVLDSRLGVKPIAKTATKTKAFRLQARYFTINGTPGITIAFVCRDWVNAADRRKAPNISEYSSQERIDSRYPIKHECRVLHVPLAPIEALDHSSIIPGSCQYLQKTRSMSPPFHQISLIRSRSQILGPLVLDDFGGEPYLTVVKDPSQIIFKPLEGGHVSIIDLLPNNEYPHLMHRIEAIRPLPQQNQILVVRSIHREPYPTLSIEMHDIPVNTTSGMLIMSSMPHNSVFFHNMLSSEIHITDYGASASVQQHRENTQKSTKGSPSTPLRPVEPHPIGVFICTTAPFSGLTHTFSTPKLVRSPPPRSVKLNRTSRGTPKCYYRYTLSQMASRARRIQTHSDCTQFRLLPGSERTLVLTAPRNTGVCQKDSSMYSAMYKLRQQLPSSSTSASDSNDSDFVVEERKPMVQEPLGLCEVPVKFRNKAEGGKVTAMAWDETVGRVVFANSNNGRVKVVDFAHMPGVEGGLDRRMPGVFPRDNDPNQLCI